MVEKFHFVSYFLIRLAFWRVIALCEWDLYMHETMLNQCCNVLWRRNIFIMCGVGWFFFLKSVYLHFNILTICIFVQLFIAHTKQCDICFWYWVIYSNKLSIRNCIYMYMYFDCMIFCPLFCWVCIFFRSILFHRMIYYM